MILFLQVLFGKSEEETNRRFSCSPTVDLQLDRPAICSREGSSNGHRGLYFPGDSSEMTEAQILVLCRHLKVEAAISGGFLRAGDSAGSAGALTGGGTASEGFAGGAIWD